MQLTHNNLVNTFAAHPLAGKAADHVLLVLQEGVLLLVQPRLEPARHSPMRFWGVRACGLVLGCEGLWFGELGGMGLLQAYAPPTGTVPACESCCLESWNGSVAAASRLEQGAASPFSTSGPAVWRVVRGAGCVGWGSESCGCLRA